MILPNGIVVPMEAPTGALMYAEKATLLAFR
jgi:hypothetical protein